MPIAASLMADLEKRYGRRRAEDIYWGMVGEGKGPFAPGGKYRAEHERWAERNDVAPTGHVKTKKKAGSGHHRKPASKKRR
jgi:hypothetical protein